MIVRARPAQTMSTTFWASSLNLKLWSTSGGSRGRGAPARRGGRSDGTLAVEIDLEHVVHHDTEGDVGAGSAYAGSLHGRDDEVKDLPMVSEQSPA